MIAVDGDYLHSQKADGNDHLVSIGLRVTYGQNDEFKDADVS